MSKSHDDLIEHLVDEIALRCDHGASAAELNHLIHEFHEPSGSVRENGETQTTESDHAVAEVPTIGLTEDVWKSLTAHPDIFLSTVSVQGLLLPQSTKHVPASAESGLLIRHYGDSVLPDGVTRQTSEVQDRLLFATQLRRWFAITGETVETSNFRHADMRLLSVIAASREHGILQWELVRVTDSDRKIVSEKLQRFQRDGYIIKSPAVVKGSFTNRVFIRRLYRNNTNNFITTADSIHLLPNNLNGVHEEDTHEEADTVELPLHAEPKLDTSIEISKDTLDTQGQKRIFTEEKNSHTVLALTSETNAESFTSEPPPKRRRGRPPKDPNKIQAFAQPPITKDVKDKVRTARYSEAEDVMAVEQAFQANTLAFAAYLTEQAFLSEEMYRHVELLLDSNPFPEFYSELFFQHRRALHEQLQSMSLPGLYVNPPTRMSRSDRAAAKKLLIVVRSSKLSSLDWFNTSSQEQSATQKTSSRDPKNGLHNFEFASPFVNISDTVRLATVIRTLRLLKRGSSTSTSKHKRRVSKSYILPHKKRRSKATSKPSSSGKQTGGKSKMPRISRTDMAIDIIRKSGGVFPGTKEMFYPLQTAMHKYDPNATVTSLSVRRLIEYLESSGKVHTVVFAYRGQGGIPKTTKLLLLPTVNVDSYAVRTIQNRIIQSDPLPYLPTEVEIDAQLREKAKEDFTRKKNRLAEDEDNATEHSHAKPSTNAAVNSIPDTEHTALEFAFQLDIEERPVSHRSRQKLQISDTYTPDKGVLMRGVEEEFQGLNAPPKKQGKDKVSFSVPTKPLDRNSSTRVGLPRLNQKMAICASLTSPTQSLHVPTGTFSTDFAVISTLRPVLSIQPGIQRAFEDKLPLSMEDILMSKQADEVVLDQVHDPHLHISQYQERDAIFSQTSAFDRFDSQVDQVQQWELANKDMLTSGGSLMQPRFINYTLPANSLQNRDSTQEDESSYTNHKMKDASSMDEIEDTPSELEDRPRKKVPNPNRGRDATLNSQMRTSMRPRDPRKRNRHSLSYPQADLEPPTNTAAGATGVDSWLPVPRGPKNTELFTGAALRRFLTAIIVIRSIIGGIERRIDWPLLDSLFPHLSQHNLEYRWRRAYSSQKRAIDQLQDDFQEKFLSAYENSELPTVNFDDIEKFDWQGLVDWAIENTDTKLNSDDPLEEEEEDTEEVDETIKLPIDLHTHKVVIDVEDHDSTARDEFYHTARTNIHRSEILKEMPFHIPITKPDFSNRPFDSAAEAAVNSTVRANLLTPEHLYKPAAARSYLSTFGESNLTAALEDLLATKLFKKQNKGRYMPGRNYGPAELFWVGYRQSFDISEMFQAAVRFKSKLDEIFQESGHLDLPFYWSDAENLVLLNLIAAGRIAIESIIPPVSTDTKTFSIDEHGNRRLSMWGFTNGGYKTSKLDRSELVFPLRVSPTATYIKGIPLPSPLPAVPGIGGMQKPKKEQRHSSASEAEPSALPVSEPEHLKSTENASQTAKVKAKPQAGSAGRSSEDRRIPLWISIHGVFLSDMWNMLLSAVVSLTALRPGYRPTEIAQLLKHGVGEWEVRLVLDWLEEVGVVSQIGVQGSAGWCAKEWWWAIFGSGGNSS